MKKALVTYSCTVEIKYPDDFCDKVRQEQLELGQKFLPLNPSDEDILSRAAWIHGIKEFAHDEAMTYDLEQKLFIKVIGEEQTEIVFK